MSWDQSRRAIEQVNAHIPKIEFDLHPLRYDMLDRVFTSDDLGTAKEANVLAKSVLQNTIKGPECHASPSKR